MIAQMDRRMLKWRATVRKARLGCELWWLRQQVEFFEWRMQWSALHAPSVVKGSWIAKSYGGHRGM
jgi:hypothetical protein